MDVKCFNKFFRRWKRIGR